MRLPLTLSLSFYFFFARLLVSCCLPCGCGFHSRASWGDCVSMTSSLREAGFPDASPTTLQPVHGKQKSFHSPFRGGSFYILNNFLTHPTMCELSCLKISTYSFTLAGYYLLGRPGKTICVFQGNRLDNGEILISSQDWDGSPVD